MAFYPKFIIFVHVAASTQTSQAETWIKMETWTAGNVTSGAFVSEVDYFLEDRCHLFEGNYWKDSCNKTHKTAYTYKATDSNCSGKPIKTSALKLSCGKCDDKWGSLSYTCGIAHPMVRINEYTDAGCTKVLQENFEPLGVCRKDKGGTSRMATCKNGKFHVITYKRPDCKSEQPDYYGDYYMYVAAGMIGSKCHTDNYYWNYKWSSRYYRMFEGCNVTNYSTTVAPNATRARATVSKSNMALFHPLLLFAALASTSKFVL